MSTIGQQLREAREAQKLTLSHVAELTKIRADHLQAIEEGRYEVFPAPVYVRGSVRTYVTLLKLDGAGILAALDLEMSQKKVFSDLNPAQRSRGVLDFVMLQLSKLDWRTSVILGGIAVVFVILGSSWLFWRHQRSVDPLKNLKPGLYQSTQTLSGQTLPLPSPKR